MRKKLQSQKGITLVALVVTIIVLIILAGVSISLVLGDNGIVTKAKLGKQNMEIAQQEEKDALSEFSNEADLYIASSSREGTTMTLLFEGEATLGEITFLNGHTIDEFNKIRFIYGQKAEDGWCGIQEREYSKETWNEAMEIGSKVNPYVIGLYSWSTNTIDLYNLSKTGFSISAADVISLYKVYGIK